MAGFPPPCSSCGEAVREQQSPGRGGHGVWIVVCADARVFWGVSETPDELAAVRRWHEASSYREAQGIIAAAKGAGGWPLDYT